SQPCRLLRWDRDRARPAGGEGFPLLLFRLQDGFTVSPWRTFLDAPLKSRTARFPGSGSKPWHVLRGPSHGLERFKRWFVYTPATPGLPTASPPHTVLCERPVLSSRAAYPTRKAADPPEPLCPARVLPPLGRRGPPPGRALPLRRRSYWLMRRSRWALSSFGI